MKTHALQSENNLKSKLIRFRHHRKYRQLHLPKARSHSLNLLSLVQPGYMYFINIWTIGSWTVLTLLENIFLCNCTNEHNNEHANVIVSFNSTALLSLKRFSEFETLKTRQPAGDEQLLLSQVPRIRKSFVFFMSQLEIFMLGTYESLSGHLLYPVGDRNSLRRKEFISFWEWHSEHGL